MMFTNNRRQAFVRDVAVIMHYDCVKTGRITVAFLWHFHEAFSSRKSP